MIKAFAGNIVFIVVLIPVLIAANLTLEIFFNAFNTSELHSTNLLNTNLTPSADWLNFFLVIVLLSANALLINFTFNSHDFYDRNTYLPSLIYILIACFFPLSIYVNGELIAQTFTILAINQLFRIKQNEDARKWVFNASLFLGFAYIFNPIYFSFFIIVFVVLFNIRPFVFRELFLAIIGFIIPLLWLILYNVITDNPFGIEIFMNSLFIHSAKLDFISLPYWLIISPHILIIPLLFVSLYFLSKRYNKSSIRFKRLIQNTIFMVVMAFLGGLLVFVSNSSYYYFSVGAVAFPFLLPYAYLEPKNKTLPTILIYFLLLIHLIKFFY